MARIKKIKRAMRRIAKSKRKKIPPKGSAARKAIYAAQAAKARKKAKRLASPKGLVRGTVKRLPKAAAKVGKKLLIGGALGIVRKRKRKKRARKVAR